MVFFSILFFQKLWTSQTTLSSKSLNDLIRPLDDNGVDFQGKLDVLTDALKQIQYSDKMSPEYLAHNLRGIKAHVNTLPQAQKTHKKKSSYEKW